MKTHLNYSVLLIATVLIVGCGGDDQSGQVARPDAVTPPDASTAEPTVASETTPETDTPDATTTEPTTTEEPSAGTDTTGTEFARFTGRITVDGDFPVLAPLVQAGDPAIKDEICTESAVPNESVIVSEDGGLRDVFVYAKAVPDGIEVPAPPEEPEQLDQEKCRFIPQALVFRVGQPLQMINSDPVAHNVRTASFFRDPLNQIISPNDQVGIMAEYERAERVPVQTKCDIHTWMLAWHLPVEHPWAVVSSEDGTFVIDNLPAGEWEFIIWHGKVGYVNRSVEFSAAAGEVVEMDFFPSQSRTCSSYQPTIHYLLSFPCAEPITT